MCLSLWLFVLQGLESCDFTLRPVCALLSIPHGVGHCKCCQWLYPLCTQALLRGLGEGIALIPKDTIFPLPSFAFCQSCLFPSHALQVWRVEWDQAFPQYPKKALSRLPPSFSRLCVSGVEIAVDTICTFHTSEVMSEDKSCCRVCSRGLYSCRWRDSRKKKRNVSIFLCVFIIININIFYMIVKQIK